MQQEATALSPAQVLEAPGTSMEGLSAAEVATHPELIASAAPRRPFDAMATTGLLLRPLVITDRDHRHRVWKETT